MATGNFSNTPKQIILEEGDLGEWGGPCQDKHQSNSKHAQKINKENIHFRHTLPKTQFLYRKKINLLQRYFKNKIIKQFKSLRLLTEEKLFPEFFSRLVS